ncbi:glucans biosynthesis glucosyltransferase MdoH [Brevundimonas sp. UBA7534]|uniref:glucans biosynthesis glucosyltransferase MdoH n=1 Tax=Brevundimonas sp. UBA7534 TaxID=1946138 RepID=UPI0025BF36FA|nr:glucans biosynthesis glucosyltransferase MdoH [Brevundimonas sp. UBA7534]
MASVSAAFRDAGLSAPDTRDFLSDLPAAAPLAMPAQALDQPPARDFGRTMGQPWARRSALIAFTVVTTVLAVLVLHDAFAADFLTGAEVVHLVLFASLFAWTAFAFASAFAGFVVSLASRRDEGTTAPLTARTAILAPVYNEAPGPVFARLEAMMRDVEAEGLGDRFDLFILSDTRAPMIAVAEQAAFRRLRQALGGGMRVFYRRRAENIDRKAGNIADWVRTWGGAYDHMVVLDADSLMTGAVLGRLSGMMQADPRAGLIQTVPAVIGASTLFARLEQFASRLYGPMFARGMAWWCGTEGNYWGHNAIIRVRAFAERAGLPHLAGRKPFGGHILSHDFVEAALMRRAGWGVRLEPDLGGSWEEGPPSLIDQIVRDRRWCQGNLQHLGVVAARGLNSVSRFHLVRGFSTYLAAPMWIALLALSIGLMVFPDDLAGARIGEASPSAAGALLGVMAVSAAFLILPKFMALAVATARGELGRFGGADATVRNILIETALSTLLAPVSLFAQTRAVVSVLSGRDSGWTPQRRDLDGLSWGEAFVAHRAEFVFGLTLAGLCLALNPAALLWAAPPALGLAGAFWLSAVTARAVGDDLLATPEVLAPHPVIVQAQILTAALAVQAEAKTPPPSRFLTIPRPTPTLAVVAA